MSADDVKQYVQPLFLTSDVTVSHSILGGVKIATLAGRLKTDKYKGVEKKPDKMLNYRLGSVTRIERVESEVVRSIVSKSLIAATATTKDNRQATLRPNQMGKESGCDSIIPSAFRAAEFGAATPN